jgi:3-phosphoshikimate 1-carboxyvinyltransferase
LTSLIVHQQTAPLSGSVTVPGDKSISHRAVLLGALTDGVTTVRNWLPAGDTMASLDAVRALGVEVEVENSQLQGWQLRILGRGMQGLAQPEEALYCANAGTCMRLLTGILAGQLFASTVDGSAQLRSRPMNRIVEPLRRMGAQIEAAHGRAPLRIKPAVLHGVDHVLPVASAQVKSALLLAGLYAQGTTRVHEPGPARDHTERMLPAMGVDLVHDEGWIGLSGPVPSLQPLDLAVPGDFSSAAFLLVAATLAPDSHIVIRQVGHNWTRTGLLDLLRQMGARITAAGEHVSGGEPVADLDVGSATLRGADAGGDTVVRTIDELPIWAVAATQAEGRSYLRDAAEMRVKEVDRISALIAELSKLGARVDERGDGFTVSGPTPLTGAEVSSRGDHRLGMALAVAGLAAAGATVIHDAGCIADSFPGFVETMRELGASMVWD